MGHPTAQRGHQPGPQTDIFLEDHRESSWRSKGTCHHQEPLASDGELRSETHPGLLSGSVAKRGHGNGSDWNGGRAICGHRGHQLHPLLSQL